MSDSLSIDDNVMLLSILTCIDNLVDQSLLIIIIFLRK